MNVLIHSDVPSACLFLWFLVLNKLRRDKCDLWAEIEADPLRLRFLGKYFFRYPIR